MKMKSILVGLLLLGSLHSLFAQLTIPSDGSDGAFNPASNVEIDLSLATSNPAIIWSDSNAGNTGKGIYDRDKWAVVFKYSSVNIPAGVTVTFKNHPSHAPVVWLVQGGVTVAGTVSLNGKNGVSGPSGVFLTEPGPGGFRGAAYGPSGDGVGLGIGGGRNNESGLYSSVYGNPQIFPLIGGSGGGPYFGATTGGGGGGVILIAASSTIQVVGSITALGGVATRSGSGGAIKLIADQITGNGNLNSGTEGRLRIESNALSATVTTSPSTIRVAPGPTPTIFQSNTSPVVRVASVDAVNAPADPLAPLDTSADIAIQKNTPVTVVLETRNFATAGAVVSVRITQKFGTYTTVNATLDSGGTTTLSTWRVNNVTIAPGFTTLQARATAP